MLAYSILSYKKLRKRSLAGNPYFYMDMAVWDKLNGFQQENCIIEQTLYREIKNKVKKSPSMMYGHTALAR